MPGDCKAKPQVSCSYISLPQLFRSDSWEQSSWSLSFQLFLRNSANFISFHPFAEGRIKLPQISIVFEEKITLQSTITNTALILDGNANGVISSNKRKGTASPLFKVCIIKEDFLKSYNFLRTFTTVASKQNELYRPTLRGFQSAPVLRGGGGGIQKSSTTNTFVYVSIL